MRGRDGATGGSETADEADDDRHTVDLVFGDGKIGIFGVKGAAEDIVPLMKDLFEDDTFGCVEDMGPAPLDKSFFADESAGHLIAGMEFGGHGVAAHYDGEIIAR